ncbi:MAG: tRNA 5-methylaminomethyl-2-thiouridine biosynthesis bifunctional protein MnmC [Cryomorphaceae bacterium]|nr:MAG: tRNA 5-methylaminomethyl-2-thiouridine biosynthesis bifunctional protein MnmC [Cryomorphaceae bacterium]
MPIASPRHLAVSADGSPTLWVPELDEHYHSIHGALTESQHVFIDAGFKAISADPVRILEVGLGTGLNAALTLQQREDRRVEYTALEKFPLTAEEINALVPEEDTDTRNILGAPAAQRICIAPGFEFSLLVEDLRSYAPDDRQFDLIYFDAFAPSAQPELWTDEIFANMFRVLSPGGALVTYCAKGVVKRSMKAAGFEVERLPGPPRKREMTRAWKR